MNRPFCRKFLFPQVDHMGQTAVEIKGLRHGYSSTPLFDNLNLTIGRGERLALVGPNGVLSAIGVKERRMCAQCVPQFAPSLFRARIDHLFLLRQARASPPSCG